MRAPEPRRGCPAAGHQAAPARASAPSAGEVALGVRLAEVDRQVGGPLRVHRVQAQRPGAEGAADPVEHLGGAGLDHARAAARRAAGPPGRPGRRRARPPRCRGCAPRPASDASTAPRWASACGSSPPPGPRQQHAGRRQRAAVPGRRRRRRRRARTRAGRGRRPGRRPGPPATPSRSTLTDPVAASPTAAHVPGTGTTSATATANSRRPSWACAVTRARSSSSAPEHQALRPVRVQHPPVRRASTRAAGGSARPDPPQAVAGAVGVAELVEHRHGVGVRLRQPAERQVEGGQLGQGVPALGRTARARQRQVQRAGGPGRPQRRAGRVGGERQGQAEVRRGRHGRRSLPAATPDGCRQSSRAPRSGSGVVRSTRPGDAVRSARRARRARPRCAGTGSRRARRAPTGCGRSRGRPAAGAARRGRHGHGAGTRQAWTAGTAGPGGGSRWAGVVGMRDTSRRSGPGRPRTSSSEPIQTA